MNEDLKKELLDYVKNRFDMFSREKEQILKNQESIDVLSNLVYALEETPANLKLYSRETLTKILSSYHSNEVIQKTLNNLEIARLVISLQDRGVGVEFNDEELNIMLEFLESVRGLRDAEIQKFQQLVNTDIRQLDDKMTELESIKTKLTDGEKGTVAINKREIDNIMHLAIEKNSDERKQIAVLRLLNKINIGIYANNFGR